MSGVLATTPSPTMEVTSAPCAVTAATPRAAAPEIEAKSVLYKIVTPYVPKAWLLTLQHADLLHLFPNLVHDLIYGTPIGDLPKLTHTFIPDNLGSANMDPDHMDSFLAEEVASGRMDGPYSIESAHHIFGGHFRTAPLGFVEKPGSSSLHLIPHHSKEDHLSMSTNNWIDTSASATKVYSAAHTADFVSTYLHIIPLFPTHMYNAGHYSHISLSCYPLYFFALSHGGLGLKHTCMLASRPMDQG